MMMMMTRESWRAEDSLTHDAVWRIGMCIIYRPPDSWSRPRQNTHGLNQACSA